MRIEGYFISCAGSKMVNLAFLNFLKVPSVLFGCGCDSILPAVQGLLLKWIPPTLQRSIKAATFELSIIFPFLILI